ncbi:Oligomerization domain-containing protein [Phlyctochytrium arcticum]|nr:Oligomerization domain-containing protein [Phlyctochytrium arcticum]
MDELLDELFEKKQQSKKFDSPSPNRMHKEDAASRVVASDVLKAHIASPKSVHGRELPQKQAMDVPEGVLVGSESTVGGSDSVNFENEKQLTQRKSIATTYYADPMKESGNGDDWYVDDSYDVSPRSVKTSSTIPRWMQGAKLAEERSRGLIGDNIEEGTGELRLHEIIETLRAESGGNLVAIDMREKCDYTDFMIIVEGRSTKQIHSLADAVRRKAKHRVPPEAGMPPNISIEGADGDDWMVLDIGRFIIHCFTPEARARYNLEGLWTAIADPLLSQSQDVN